MKYLRRIFGSVNTRYLIRAYVLSFVFTGLIIYSMVIYPPPETLINWPNVTLLVISALLYPFSKLVYDELKAFLLGNNIFYFDAPVFVIAKLFINVCLFVFAIFIAPLGVLYLHLRSRRTSW